MKYSNGFSINVTGEECFLTFLQNRPQGETKSTEEVDTVVMTERCARQLMLALAKVYQKVDAERQTKKAAETLENTTKLS